MHSERDIQILTNIRKYLIEISSKVYRDYKFFFQSENKEQRRSIYNHTIEITGDDETYPIVCKSCCERIKQDLISLYGYDIEVICCDSDEFGHCDILIHGDKDYIINCLSDLELNQVGMKSKRFASRKYCEERYPDLLNNERIAFLSSDEVEKIDEEIGFFNGMYFDDVIDRLSLEFHDFSKYLKSDDGLREALLGNVDTLYVDDMDTLELLQAKFKFLCNYFNGRQNIIGHIELIRIYKMLLKKFFSKDELKLIKWNNCFFDRTDNSLNYSIFNTSQARVRFISFEIGDMVYLISIVSNEFVYMSSEEWRRFKDNNCVIIAPISGSNDSISEYLRNKGIGVNIMKHSVVKQILNDIEDCIFCTKDDDGKKSILDEVYNQGNKVLLTDDFNNRYCIFLDDYFIKITINDDPYMYYYIGDNLNMSSFDEKIVYEWKDEGKYEEHVYRKTCN